MPGTRKCAYGSGKRWHAKSKQCRAPCSKKGAGWRRSSKGPYYQCKPPSDKVRKTPKKCKYGMRKMKSGQMRCKSKKELMKDVNKYRYN